MQEDKFKAIFDRHRSKHEEFTPNLAVTWLLLVLLGLITTRASAQDHSERTWRLPAGALKRVEVNLVRGNVIVRRGSDSYVIVHIRQNSDSTAIAVPVVQTEQDVLRIAATYARAGLRSLSECLPPEDELGDFWATHDLVEIELKIPAGIGTRIRSMQGDIELSGLEGALDVATNEGVFTLNDSTETPNVVATGSVIFIRPAQAESSAIPAKLTQFGGDIQMWVKRGDALTIDGRSVVASLKNVEVARADDAVGRSFTVRRADAEIPINVELSRGRLWVLALDDG